MCNAQHGAIREFGANGALDFGIGLKVNGRRGFIQQNNLAVFHKSACERHQTALTHRKISTLFVNDRVKCESCK